MFKKKGAIYLIIVALAVLLVLTSCDPRKGTLNPNLQPEITITNYFGVDIDTLITQSYLFQQTVQWSGTDADGVVNGYAFRVLNEDENPIATPGYDVIDENGWVKFYTSSADLSIPLDQSAQTTIWMDKSYATINFPAADANGDSANVVSIFEVKCIDNADSESEIARKYFQAHSNTPTVSVVSSKGDIDGETISTAIVFSFTMLDEDPIIVPYYYEYKLHKVNLNGDTLSVADGGYPDEWISTLGSDDISLALHSAIRPDFAGGPNALLTNEIVDDVPQDSTFLFARATDAAMIVSDVVEIAFVVKDGFYPGTVIYYGDDALPGLKDKANAIHALGTNHFATFIPVGSTIENASIIYSADEIHYSTPFWVSTDNKYSAIGSSDFKTYMRWGYFGEFEDSNPFLKKDEVTLDDVTEQSYFCEIIGYDIRLDDEPYYYPPIPAEGAHLQVDDNGKEWLRVYTNYPIDQQTSITQTSFGGSPDYMYGDHIFEVRAIDLQGAVDLTPHEYCFTIVEPVPKEEKTGVLIIDDDVDHEWSPGELVDSLYTYFVSGYVTEHGYINRKDLGDSIDESEMGKLHLGSSIIAPSDMQQYKAVIYHTDKGDGTSGTELYMEYEALKIYLMQGGNLIVSGGGSLKTIHELCANNGYEIFEDYFGILSYDDNAIGRVSSEPPYIGNPFFIKAVSEGSLNDIDLLLPSFNTIITNQQIPDFSVNGFGPVAYFNEHNAEVIFTYGCKEVAEDPPSCPYHINPTQEEYDQYNGLSVALKYETSNNSCYIFGFPLSYMKADHVKDMMTQILNDLP